MANTNFKVVLDVLTNLNVDKTQINKFAADVTKTFKSINPDLKFDDAKVAKQMNNILKQFDTLKTAMNAIDKNAPEIEIKANTDAVNEAIKQVRTALAGVSQDGVQLNISDEEVKNFAKELSTAFESSKQQIKDFQKELQNSATDAGDVAKATETIRQASSKISIADKFANLGLASQGLRDFATGLADMAQPYLQLDQATQQIKTLGGEATANAEKFKQSSLSMATSVGIDAQAIQSATYDALSAGIDASEQSINAFMTASSKLAVGGNVAVGDTVNLLSSMLNAYGETADKTSEYSDILFETVNLGKISVGEMVSSMSQVVPTASAMGYSLKDVGTALAIMTSNGIPAAQATTKLNQLLVEIQKPSTNLAQALGAAGVSSEDLGAKIKSGDVVGALGEMKTAFETAGVSATQAFSSTEASAAFNTLTKDMDKLTSTTEAFGNATGTTDAAFGEMQNSITNRAENLRRTVENTFMQIADSSGAFGTLALTFAQSAKSLSPMLSSVMQLKSLLGPTIEGATSAMKTLITQSALMGKIKGSEKLMSMFSGMKSGAESAAEAILKKVVPGLFAQTTATGTATGAQTAFNTAANANPLGVIIIAIIASLAVLTASIIGIVKLFNMLNPSHEEQLKNLKEQTKEIDKQVALQQQKKDTATNNKQLLTEYEELTNKTNKTAEEQKRLNELQLQMAKNMPDVVNRTTKLDDKMKELDASIEGFNTKIREQKDNKISIGLEIDAEKTDMATDKLFDKLDVSGPLKASLQKQINAIKIEKDPAKARELTQQLKKNVFSAEEYQNLSANDKKVVDKSLLQIENATGDRLNQMKAKMKLNAEGVADSITNGISTKKPIDLNNIGNNGKAVIEKVYPSEEEIEKRIKAIADATGRGYDEVAAEVDTKVKEIRDKNISGAIADATKVEKGKQDLSGLDDLVDKFKNAKTVVEKESYAEAIKKMAPDAVKWTGQVTDANGKLIDSYEVSGEKIDECKKKENERLNGDNKKAIEKFRSLIEQEGAAYDKNKQKIAEVQAQLAKAKATGNTEEIQKLEKQYDGLINKNKEYKNDLLDNAVKWKSAGHSMDETAEMFAKTLHKSPEEVKKLIVEQEKSIAKTKDQVKYAQLLANGFGDAQNKHSKNLEANTKKAQDARYTMDLLKAQGKTNTEEYRKAQDQYNQAIKNGVYDTKELNNLNKISAEVSKKMGTDEEKSSKTTTQEKKSQYEIAKDKYDLETKILNNTYKQNQLTANGIKEETIKTIQLNKLRTEHSKQLLNTFISQFAKLDEKGQIKLDEKGQIMFNAKFDKNAKADLMSQYLDLAKDVSDAEKTEIDFSAKIKDGVTEEIYKQIDKIISDVNTHTSKNQLKLAKTDLDKLELVYSTAYDNYVNELKKSQDEYNKAVAEANATFAGAGNEESLKTALDALKEKYAGTSGEITKITEEWQKKDEAIKKASLDVGNKMQEEKTKKEKKESDKRKKQLDEEIEYKQKEIEKYYSVIKAFDSAYAEGSKNSETDKYNEETEKLTDAYDKRKEKLDKMKDEGNLSDVEYNKLAEDEEDRHNKKLEESAKKHEEKMKQIEAMKEGAEKFDEYTKKKEELQTQLDKANKDLEDARATGNEEMISSTQAKVDEATKKLSDSGSMLTDMLSGLGGQISDSLGNLFAGDPEAAKEGMKSYLAMMVGYLKQKLALLVLDIFTGSGVGKYLANLPVPLNIGASAVVFAAIKSAVNTIANPILNGISSFSSGGLVTSPTLAVVGDAAKLGSDNKEWIFRDEQLQQTIQMANSLSSNTVNKRLGRIEKLLASQELSTTLKGNDIVISQKRTVQKINNRAR